MTEDRPYQRLSDLILEALTLSLEQKDVVISDILSRALEMSITRNAGGRDFIERRDLSQDVESALEKLYALKREAKGRD
ncbi:MAG TPA: hypothetical protein PLW48_05580 [Alphaproteobacteria bacterium]|nr:hypothetical protein [Alphaproteobacteria bacterium]HRI75905.1 hypothetical protein [Alphaproteobacteria bacterium]HRJ66588.1 hypothetical protein [Alphaproteobacteria bacterium]